jgi:hypothetical protein
MPCMGPNINEEELHQAYNEIMTLLKEKYGLQKHQPFFLSERMIGMRAAYNEQLRQALRNLFFQQASEDF